MKKLRFIMFTCLITVALGGLTARYGQATQNAGPKVGEAAPALGLSKVLQAPAGAEADWAKLKGKIVVLEFWATWCGPCIAQQPHLNELADKFADKPIQFISITDEDERRVANFLSRRKLKGWVGLDTQRLAKKAYNIYGIPETIVVDQSGKIAAQVLPQQLDEKLLNQVLDGTYTIANSEKPGPKLMADDNKPAAAEPAQLTISIKPSKAATWAMGSDNGKFNSYGAPLKSILANLLGTTGVRIRMPAQFEENKYDISLTLLNDKDESYKPLLVNALETALGLKVQRKTEEVDVYVLTAPHELTAGLKPTLSKSFHLSSADGVLGGSNAELHYLASQLEDSLGAPVIDETGLKDKFDWDLFFDSKKAESIPGAVSNDLGLVLTKQKRQIEVVVVESVKP